MFITSHLPETFIAYLDFFAFPVVFSAICTIIYYKLLTRWQNKTITNIGRLLQQEFQDEKIISIEKPDFIFPTFFSALFFFVIGLAIINIFFKATPPFEPNPKIVRDIFWGMLTIIFFFIISNLTSYYILILTNKRIITKSLFSSGEIHQNYEFKLSEIQNFNISHISKNTPVIILTMKNNSEYKIEPRNTQEFFKMLQHYHWIERN